jgi:hypothetical protein
MLVPNTMLLNATKIKADVVHARGYKTADSGHPLCHFFIYKSPRGALHYTHLPNSYEVDKNDKKVELEKFYSTNTARIK